MLVLRSFHSPLVVIPFEKEKFIPNSQPFLGMAMDEEHEVEIDVIQDVSQGFFNRNRCSNFYSNTFFSHNKDFEDLI